MGAGVASVGGGPKLTAAAATAARVRLAAVVPAATARLPLELEPPPRKEDEALMKSCLRIADVTAVISPWTRCSADRRACAVRPGASLLAGPDMLARREIVEALVRAAGRYRAQPEMERAQRARQCGALDFYESASECERVRVWVCRNMSEDGVEVRKLVLGRPTPRLPPLRGEAMHGQRAASSSPRAARHASRMARAPGGRLHVTATRLLRHTALCRRG